MNLEFAWDDWNLDHIAGHGVGRKEAEYVIRHAMPPWPAEKGDGKLVVWGASEDGKLLQVIFVLKQPDELEFDALEVEQSVDIGDDDRIVYVIHAMPLTDAMKKQFRRRMR